MNINKPGIYAIQNKINNKMYIGSTKQPIIKRFKQHIKKLKEQDHNIHLLNAYNKYGKDNFKLIVLQNVESYEFDILYSLEAEWILKYNTLDRQFGYNINDIYNSNRGYKFTDEQKINLSNALKGKMVKEANPMFKYSHTEESKSKMSESRIGMGHTEEQKEKWSKNRSGKNNPMFGKKPECHLNKEDFQKIKEKLLEETNEGWCDKYKRIAKEFNTYYRLISDIKNGKHKACNQLGGGYKEWI